MIALPFYCREFPVCPGVGCRRAEQSFFFLVSVPVLAPVRGRGQLEEAAVMTGEMRQSDED